MSNYCPQNFGRPNQRSLAICLVGSQQTYFQFQLRAAFLSLAPSSAKGYYATVPSRSFWWDPLTTVTVGRFSNNFDTLSQWLSRCIIGQQWRLWKRFGCAWHSGNALHIHYSRLRCSSSSSSSSSPLSLSIARFAPSSSLHAQNQPFPQTIHFFVPKTLLWLLATVKPKFEPSFWQ